jgi:ribosomal protein L20
MDKQGGISHFFDLVDPDADGEVDKIELSLALKKLLKITNKDLHPKDIRGLFEHLDADNSHSIDKDEFVQVFGLPSDRKGAAECIANRRKGESRNATQASQGLSAQEKVAKEYKMKKQEAAKNQLLKHVRERVSLLCRRRGLKDLWISKMCQGLRKGKLNRSSFKAGLRHLGCRGFGPGDSDLLFDFCVDHHALDNNQESVIGFTAFSRVFSPDTFHYTTINPNESGGAGIDKSELAGSAGTTC